MFENSIYVWEINLRFRIQLCLRNWFMFGKIIYVWEIDLCLRIQFMLEKLIYVCPCERAQHIYTRSSRRYAYVMHMYVFNQRKLCTCMHTHTETHACVWKSSRRRSRAAALHACVHTYLHTYIHTVYTCRDKLQEKITSNHCMHTYMHAYIHTYNLFM